MAIKQTAMLDDLIRRIDKAFAREPSVIRVGDIPAGLPNMSIIGACSVQKKIRPLTGNKLVLRKCVSGFNQFLSVDRGPMIEEPMTLFVGTGSKA